MSPRPLARRLATAAMAGALVTAFVGAVLAVPLIRSVARDQARAELARTIDALAASPRVSAELLIKERATVGPDDRRYGVLGPTSTGDALDFLTAADTATLRRTGRLSTSHRVDGQIFLIEGRQVTKGALARRGVDVVAAQPVGNVGAATGALVRRLALALALGLLAAAALAGLLARRAARPVREAARRAHRLADGERGLPSPPPSSIAEIDEMSQALGALDTALATSESRQREFLLSISHELRTPLTALLGYAEALRDGTVPAEEIADVGRILAVETERLDRFIADLLALARLQADDFRLESTNVDLGRLIDDAVAAWQASARNAGVGIESAQVDELIVSTDPMRLRQLLDGLIENALRASPAGGSVSIDAAVSDRGAVISVTDDGPGLEPGEHEHAFERGYLRDRYASQRQVGTGLGLSIAHRLAERMHARLEAAPGERAGTVMRVWLADDHGQA